MNYPAFKKFEALDEFDCVLNEKEVISVRLGKVTGFGTIEHPGAVQEVLEKYQDSNKEEFLEACDKAMEIIKNKIPK